VNKDDFGHREELLGVIRRVSRRPEKPKSSARIGN
jgi:hypothetical protein